MSIGKISEFDVHKDNWKLYVERLEQYFKVNKIEEALQVSTLITVIGAECYELLVNLCTPEKPSSKTFKQLTDILQRHLQPKPSILAERYKFRNRKQLAGESIAEYIAVLKKMSTTCEFKDALEDNLRDQFSCNIHSESIRQRLFAEDELSFAQAYKLAVNLEAAERNAAAVIQGHSAVGSSAQQVEVHALGPWQTRAGGGGPAVAGWWGQAGGGGRVGRAQAGPRGAGRQQPAPASGPAAAAARGRCRACGGSHDAGSCRFARYVCRVCNQMGHLKRMCPCVTDHHNVQVTSPSTESSRETDYESDEVIVDVNNLLISECKPILVTVSIANLKIDMECDTGSAISCISYEFYKQNLVHLNLEPCKLVLRYLTGEIVRPVGLIKPIVKYKNVAKQLDLYVVNDGKTKLLGRQWLAELGIEIPKMEYNVNNVSECDLSSRYCEAFADGLGRFTGGPVSIHVRPDARPVFLRARPLAYALREPVERALEQLVRDDILEPVERSDWATPIVPVVKKDGTVRICADYKLTLNKVLEIDRYPLPKVEDLLARLHGGEHFSKIDLSQAYAQFELDETRKFTVINTHRGLFMYKRLVYGLASSPGIFQRKLEQLFADLPFVGVFLDDIIISGKDRNQHLENLHKVFQRLQTSGLRVKKDKCVFFAESVDYLGHVISKAGVHTCTDKVKAIENTAAPTTVSELRSFIGMVMYYAKFIRNVSTILAPLYRLLRSGVKFEWGTECEAAFQRVKQALTSSEVLVHYSVDLPLILTSDASGTGVGAVISHLTPEGERPIAYASRTLTAAEQAYAQIDREALSIVFGIRKFHQYLYGRKFILRTDHKPLTYIFGSKVGIPVMAASRLQRWAILLSGYNYEIEYVPSAKNCADALSRLPQTGQTQQGSAQEVTYLNFVEKFLPVTNNDIRNAITKDQLVSRIVAYVQSGWPVSCMEEDVKPYFQRRNELYLDRGCLMWGYRIVVPAKLRGQVLQQLHASHMGIVKTKSLARSYVWWPDIDADVESTCRSCETCAAEAQAPPKAPPQPWPYCDRPWSRLHVDFLGPFQGRTFFVIIDSSSKWIEIFEMRQTSAHSVIRVLRATFARFGLPTEVVSDQGPPFTSVEFRDFLARNGIRQSFAPTYHPASNGAAENAVKLCKRAIKKAVRDEQDVEAALQTFLLAYRNSIHSTTGETPAMLLQKRPLRSRLDLLRSDGAKEQCVQRAQQRQVDSAGGVARELAAGEAVWARNYRGQDKWVPRTVLAQEGSRRYILGDESGQLTTRHVDQIRRRSNRSSIIYPELTVEGGKEDVAASPGNKVPERVTPCAEEREEGVKSRPEALSPKPTDSPQVSPPLTPVAQQQPTPRRSQRVRKPPVRYGFEFD